MERKLARADDEPHRRDTKDRILDVAESLFSSQGYDGTGIEQIAHETGITKSVIYYHFKNKEAVLQGIFERARRRYAARVKNIAPPPSEKRSVADIFADLLRGEGGLEPYKSVIRIMFMETMKPGNPDPLFDLWESNISAILENCDEPTRDRLRANIDQFRLESFFLFFAPVAGLLAFEESWSARYGIPTAEIRKRLSGVIGPVFQYYLDHHERDINPQA